MKQKKINVQFISIKGSIMFHVRRRPADSQPRRRKKKPLGVSNGSNNITIDREGPILVEITHSGDGGRRVKLTSEPIEVNKIFISINLIIYNINSLLCIENNALNGINNNFKFRSDQLIRINYNYSDHQFNQDIVSYHFWKAYVQSHHCMLML